MDKERDIVYKNLSDELKPYFENCDCCSDIVKLRKESKDLQQRIDKVVELIEPLILLNGTMTTKGLNKLLNILKGDDTND